MNSKVNKKKKKKLNLDSNRFSRVSGINYINDDLFESNY